MSIAPDRRGVHQMMDEAGGADEEQQGVTEELKMQDQMHGGE